MDVGGQAERPRPKAAAAAISFGFSKRSAGTNKVLTGKNAIGDTKGQKATGDTETDFVREINRAEGIKGTKKKEVKRELVIPCRGNDIQLGARAKKEENDEDAAAAREVLADVERWKQDQEDGVEESKNAILEVEMFGKDVEGRAEQSTMDDYEAVPVEGFGLGMLRGMGFKPGEGIGGFKKLDVKCIDPVMRPKGLGLGATRPNAGQDTKAKKNGEGEELVLKKGAYVQLRSGAHRDLYGQVEGMDEESARAFVKLAVGSQVVSVSENAARVVDKKEYKRFAKVINKEMYEVYREKQERKQMEWDRGREERTRLGGRESDEPDRKRRKKGDEDRGDDGKNGRHHDRRREGRRDWVRPSLRVRFIDRKYKGGKYYNSKVVVDDVVASDRCVCRTDDGRILDDVHPRHLETIVPRNEGSVVMIVGGDGSRQRLGRLGELVWRDKKSCRVAVQLLPDKDDVLKLDFDDICEFVGEVTDS